MKRYTELNLGFGDAENYRRRENREFLSRVFVKSNYLDQLCDDNIFFLIGEKGTGKTAYAVYLANNTHRNTSALLTYIRETEYQQFVSLKQRNHLLLSDYTNIWRVIILLLLSEKISLDRQEKSIFGFSRFRRLKEAIDDYYVHAFAPEILQALSFVDRSSLSAKLLAQYAELGSKIEMETSFTENRFQTNLMFIRRQFEEALSEIKLKNSHILFIDGIDIRPSSIEYENYLECVKGLANAVWSINNDFFANIKDSKGRLRVVLLIRPDIFDSLNLQNQSNKVRDNSILLDWRTTYSEYRSSLLFRMADKLLSSQQSEKLDFGEAWGQYFPYKVLSKAYYREDSDMYDHSFIPFLRYSLYRPRDIVTMLSILQENKKNKNLAPIALTEDDFNDSSFKRQYSTYLLGQVRDHLSFYYSASDYESFMKFFQFLHGKTRFDYDMFCNAFGEMTKFLKKNNIKIPAFLEATDEFLQFLYELNVICYIEDPVEEMHHRPFISWCFRDRTISNISPKVKTGVRYEIHYGLTKALRTGMPLKK